jgi:hypothetical protein
MMECLLAEIRTNQERLGAEIEAVTRSLRSSEVLSSPGWIPTKPGQGLLKKKCKPRWTYIKKIWRPQCSPASLS